MSRAATVSRGLSAPGMRAVLIAWLAALAIAFQCIVVQSHVHVSATPALPQQASVDQMAGLSSDPSIASRDLDTRHAPSPADPAGCFICQQIAMAGAAVLPDSPTPIIIELAATVQLVVAEVAAHRTRASHDWRSRAPPLRP